MVRLWVYLGTGILGEASSELSELTIGGIEAWPYGMLGPYKIGVF